MAFGRLNKVIGFWKGLTFTNNVKKMRKVLMDYLKEEGVKCVINDGDLIVTYDDTRYAVEFQTDDIFAESKILCIMSDDIYTQLPIDEKTYIADKANIEMDNHCRVSCYEENFAVETYYYFTNESMLLNLFTAHLEEMRDTVKYASQLVVERDEGRQQKNCQRIGFNAYSEDENKTDKITAKA